MSWWITLEGAGDVPRHTHGGTHALGGTQEAELNVTYNYSGHFVKHLHSEGIKWLSGKKASDTIEQLKKAVEVLGIIQDDDYWNPTTGNAGHALCILLEWAKLYPEGVWRVL